MSAFSRSIEIGRPVIVPVGFVLATDGVTAGVVGGATARSAPTVCQSGNAETS